MYIHVCLEHRVLWNQVLLEAAHSPVLQKPRLFHHDVQWDIADIRMLLGSDLPIFGRDSHPAISLRLRCVCVCVSIHVYVYMCMYTCGIHVYIHVYNIIHVYVYMCMYMCMYMYEGDCLTVEKQHCVAHSVISTQERRVGGQPHSLARLI